MKDFTPTKETISLHGLGFIQLQLENNCRLHVWHPELPRRICFVDSSIHNHRFSFESAVIKGTQVNRRIEIELTKDGSHEVISHNGPRSPKGGRISYPVAECNIFYHEPEKLGVGQTYFMNQYDYHETPNSGTVITFMRKLEEGNIHANSIIVKGKNFDQEFDRFQLSPDELFDYVRDAFKS